MKTKYIPLIIVALIAILFIPIQERQTVIIKSAFLRCYQQLIGPRSWVKWHAGLKESFLKDSAKISFITKAAGYEINTPARKVDVHIAGNTIYAEDVNGATTNNYTYVMLPGKTGKETIVNVALESNIFNFLKHSFTGSPSAKTHIFDFKKYMETDSLFYGYHIYKIRVPQVNLVVLKKKVPVALQFTEAQKSFTTLKKFVADKQLTKTDPLIAQFLPSGKDSTLVNIGFFVDRKVKSEGQITASQMIKNGPLVVADFKGPFNGRAKAYRALYSYFKDHAYETAVLPFETYYNDRLPKSINDTVKIRINFTSFQ